MFKQGRKGRPRKAQTEYLGKQKPFDHVENRAEYLAAFFRHDPEAVYIMEAGEQAIKIGRSKNPRQRARDLQIGQEKHIRVVYYIWLSRPDTVKLESAIHKLLRGAKVPGMGEWYYLPADTGIKIVEKMAEKLGLDFIRESRIVWVEGIGKTHGCARGLPIQQIGA
jgi:hypothetical protein